MVTEDHVTQCNSVLTERGNIESSLKQCQLVLSVFGNDEKSADFSIKITWSAAFRRFNWMSPFSGDLGWFLNVFLTVAGCQRCLLVFSYCCSVPFVLDQMCSVEQRLCRSDSPRVGGWTWWQQVVLCGWWSSELITRSVCPPQPDKHTQIDVRYFVLNYRFAEITDLGLKPFLLWFSPIFP